MLIAAKKAAEAYVAARLGSHGILGIIVPACKGVKFCQNPRRGSLFDLLVCAELQRDKPVPHDQHPELHSGHSGDGGPVEGQAGLQAHHACISPLWLHTGAAECDHVWRDPSATLGPVLPRWHPQGLPRSAFPQKKILAIFIASSPACEMRNSSVQNEEDAGSTHAECYMPSVLLQ